MLWSSARSTASHRSIHSPPDRTTLGTLSPTFLPMLTPSQLTHEWDSLLVESATVPLWPVESLFELEMNRLCPRSRACSSPHLDSSVPQTLSQRSTEMCTSHAPIHAA